MSDRAEVEAIVQQVLPAPPEVVYDEWLDPAALAEWMCPRPAFTTNIEIDATVGGRLRFDIDDEGRRLVVTGRYLDLDRPHRISFTWSCSTWPEPDLDTVVTVTFQPDGAAKTLMTIRHTLLPPDLVANHHRGWVLIARQLEEKLQAAPTTPRLTSDQLIDRFRTWAARAADVRALAVIGSHARALDHADEWSDLDLVLVADEPDRYLASGEWLDEIGPCRLTFVEEAPIAGLHERRAHFEGGLEVDCIIITPEMLEAAARLPEVADVVARGWRVLVDKDALTDRFTSRLGSGTREPTVPSDTDLAEATARYWHKAVWSARKLCRGELWVATRVVNHDLHQFLLQALEWEAQTRAGEQPDAWFRGRFLERWADPETLRRLPETFAGYDPAAVAHALRVLTQVYRRLTDVIARRIECEVPRDVHAYGSELLGSILDSRFPIDAS